MYYSSVICNHILIQRTTLTQNQLKTNIQKMHSNNNNRVLNHTYHQTLSRSASTHRVPHPAQSANRRLGWNRSRINHAAHYRRGAITA